MADDSTAIELSRSELREGTGYAVACARPALAVFERKRPMRRSPSERCRAASTPSTGGIGRSTTGRTALSGPAHRIVDLLIGGIAT
ncbi:MAG: hypothetical protein M0026_07665 [Nocardiopsaceae bacterium]|nr:hypothetical protein [Nocardiopsaceae bacterium]